MDPVDLDIKSNPDEFDPWMYFQNLIKMFYDPKANHLKLNPFGINLQNIFVMTKVENFPFFNTSSESDDNKLLAEEAFPELLGFNIADFILTGRTDTDDFPNFDTISLALLGEVSNAGFIDK